MTGRNTIWLCILVIITTMFYRLSPMIAEQDTVYRTYAPLVEVDALIKRHFVEQSPDRKLVDGAIRGMMLQLDPYSGYITPERMADFKFQHTGAYIGIGLELGMADGKITVIAPVDQSPAMRAGIHPGDVVLAVEGRSTEELSVVDVENLLVGEPDTHVELTLARPTKGTVEFTVDRSRVNRGVVRGFRRRPRERWDYLVDPERHIAYIRVSQFVDGMIDDFDAALRIIEQEGAAALVIDLRFNPGGLLPQAIALVDRFVESGTILTTVTRREAIDTYAATAPQTDSALPLVVLVNNGSASSSEIVAGALQDHGRAVVVGERSFGKGSVQKFIALHGSDGGIKLTIAHYQLPGGRIIHRTPDNAGSEEWGITPDVMVPLDASETEAVRASRHTVDASPSPKMDDPSARTPATLIDRQLQAAIDVLVARIGSGALSVPAMGGTG